MFTFRRSLVACGIAASILSPARAQNITTPPGRPGYVNAAAVNATRIDPNTPASTFVFQIPATGVDSTSVFMNPTLGRTGSNSGGNIRFPANGGTILGLRAASTFGGAFAAQAGPTVGQVYKYTILGNPPIAGGTTNIAANIDEISWTLLKNSSGNPSEERLVRVQQLSYRAVFPVLCGSRLGNLAEVSHPVICLPCRRRR